MVGFALFSTPPPLPLATPRPTAPAPRRLVDVLRALPGGELDALIARLGVRVDPTKRIDAPAQVARALVQLPELRDPSRLAPASVELLHRVAEAKGALVVQTVPPALEPLLARGLMFARGTRGAVELVLPTAHLLALRSWEGEDPRSLRALLSQASFETTSAIAAHYLGRPATPPIALSLEGRVGHARQSRKARRRNRAPVVHGAAGARGRRARRGRGRHRGAPRARARAAALSNRHGRDAVPARRRLLAGATRAPRPRPPQPARRAHRSLPIIGAATARRASSRREQVKTSSSRRATMRRAARSSRSIPSPSPSGSRSRRARQATRCAPESARPSRSRSSLAARFGRDPAHTGARHRPLARRGPVGRLRRKRRGAPGYPRRSATSRRSCSRHGGAAALGTRRASDPEALRVGAENARPQPRRRRARDGARRPDASSAKAAGSRGARSPVT